MELQPIIKSYVTFKDDEARIVGKEHLKAEYVARMHVDGNAPIEEVMEHYSISRAQVYGALAYYYENQTILDAEYNRSWDESQGTHISEWRKIISERYKQMQDNNDTR